MFIQHQQTLLAFFTKALFINFYAFSVYIFVKNIESAMRTGEDGFKHKKFNSTHSVKIFDGQVLRVKEPRG